MKGYSEVLYTTSDMFGNDVLITISDMIKILDVASHLFTINILKYQMEDNDIKSMECCELASKAQLLKDYLERTIK